MRLSILSALAILLAISCVTVLDAEELIIQGAQVKLKRYVKVPVREAGILIKLNVKAGDMVDAGDVIAQIEDELYNLNQQIDELEYQHAALSSTNDVNKRFAEKSQEVSLAVLERSKQAVARYEKSISKTELEKLRLESERDGLAFEQAEMEIQLAKLDAELKSKELAVSKLKLDYRTIAAPFNGMVVETFPQEGEWVNTGDPVVRIIDLDTLHVEAAVDASMYDSSLVGKKINFIVKLPGRDREETFEGVIDFVNPEIEPVGDRITIQAEIINRMQMLRPGTKGSLKILLD